MIYASFKRVFSDNKIYTLLAIFIAAFVFIISTWLGNLNLILQVLNSSNASIADKLSILASLVGSIGTNFTLFSAAITIVIAILFGINVAMVIYYVIQKKAALRKSGMASGFGGLFSGMLGIGCASCGTLVLGPFISFLGGAALITLLPFGGQEFGLLGIILISFSIYLTAKNIQAPVICEQNKSMLKGLKRDSL